MFNQLPVIYASTNDDGLVVAIIECPETWNFASNKSMIKLDKYDDSLIDNCFYNRDTKKFIHRSEYWPEYKTEQEAIAEVEAEVQKQALTSLDISLDTDSFIAKVESLEEKINKLTDIITRTVTNN